VDLRGTLDEFTGEWEGEYKIYALDGDFNRAYPAQRKYEWKEEVQRVESTYSGAGELKHFQGENSIKLGRIYSNISSRGRPVEKFEGEITKKGILWKNIHNKNRNYKERVVQTPEGIRLETEGFEVFPARGISGLVKVVGLFHRPGVVFSEGSQKEDSILDEPKKVEEKERPAKKVSEESSHRRAQEEAAEAMKVHSLKNEIKEASSEIKALKDYLSESKENVQHALVDKQLLKKQLEEITVDRDNLKSLLENRNVVYQQNIDSLKATEARIIDVEKEQEGWIASNKDLNEQVGSLTEEVNSIQKMNTSLVQDKENLEAKLQLVSGERESLRKEVKHKNALLEEVEAIRFSMGENNAENEALEARVKSLSAELTGLQDQLKAEGKPSDRRAAEIESLRVENQKLSEMVASYKSKEASFMDELSKWEISKATYEATLKEVGDERENDVQIHAKEISEVRLEVKRLEEEIGGLTEERSGFLNTIEQLKNLTTKLEQEKKSSELFGAKITAQLTELQSDGESIKEKVHGYESKLQVVIAERDLLLKEKSATEEKIFQMNEGRAETERKLVAFDTQVAASNREKEILEGEMQELQKALSISLTERDGFDQERKAFEQKILGLERALSEVEQAALASAAQITVLEQQGRSETRDQWEEFSTEKALLQKKIESMERQLRSFDQSNADLMRENQRLVDRQKDYDRIGAANDSLVNGLRATQAEVEVLKKELAESKRRLAAPTQRGTAPVKSGSRKGSSRINAQVISGARSTPLRPQNEINEVISSFKIIGVNRSPRGDKIILNGQVFQVGEIVDYAREITFLRLESDAIIFGGPDKAEYRLKL
jgi:chromosome segregation ATPase